MSLAVRLDFDPRTPAEFIARVIHGRTLRVSEPYDARFLGNGTSIDIDVSRYSDRTRYRILQHEHCKFVYDTELLVPIVSFANVNFGERVRTKESDIRVFTFDPQVPESQQAGPEFYVRDPFDRGHLTQRLAVAWGEDAMPAQIQSDYYTNITPQYENFNRILWAKIEDEARRITNEESDYQKSIDVSGVWFAYNDKIYDSDEKKTRQRRVPNAFWKISIVLKQAKSHVRCFFVPHEKDFDRSKTAKDFSVSLNELSKKLGYKVDERWKL